MRPLVRFLRVVGAFGLGGWSGAFTGMAAEAPVELPPLIVSEGRGARPWRFASSEGIEVLARCDDDIIVDTLRRLHDLTEITRVLIPDEQQYHTTQPQTVILVEAADAPGLSRALVEQFTTPEGKTRPPEATTPAPPLPDPPPGTNSLIPRLRPEIRMMPNLELSDVDAETVFALVNPTNFESERMGFTPQHMRLVVERRVPPLPRWFLEGYRRLTASLEFTRGSMRLPPLVWQDATVSRRLREDPDAVRELLPATEFFTLARRGSEAELERWTPQAELFVRWCLETEERRRALWRFLAMRSVESEERLRTCFGIGYADWRDRLSDYLPRATDETLEFGPVRLSKAPKIAVRNATPAEIGRLKGEWDRLVAGFVQRRYPDYAGRYQAMAQDTLDRARTAAPNDPHVLTEIGLLAIDSGDLGKGRSYLEAAYATGVRLRPRAIVELASFRAMDVDDANGAGLSLGQVMMIRQLLQEAEAQQPPLAVTYALRAKLITAREERAPLDELRKIQEGFERFPQHPALLYYGSLVAASYISIDRSLQLVETGAASAPTPQLRARFEDLKARLLHARDEAAAAAADKSKTTH